MNFLFTLNDKFSAQVGTCICSICENNKRASQINFYLISFKISASNKDKFKYLTSKYNRNLKIIELKNIEKYFDFDFDTLGWNSIILARLLMDKLLPLTVNKIIYLDGDTIVRNNISELWEIDLTNKTLGMSIEPTADKERRKLLNIENKYYYNSGVMLVNLKRFREINAGERIINYYRSRGGVLFAADQDAINGSLNDEILPISPKFNYYNIFDQYPYWFLKKISLPLNYVDYEIFLKAKNNPSIIHYLGEERPWRMGNHHKYKNDYKKYLSLTPWKNTEEEKGWELYFIIWDAFNFITKPFPSLRLHIINSLIPKFMDKRKRDLKKRKNYEK